MSRDVKLLRGQLRQIVKETLPEILKEEIYKAIEARVLEKIEGIEKFVKAQLADMTKSHRDTMGYLVRSVTVSNKDTK